MIKHWIHLFIKSEDYTDPKTRTAAGKLSGFTGLVCNLLLFGVKLLAGFLTGSVSITADAMNNLSDASASIVTLAGFRLAELPPDERHPYGHARFEYLSGLAVSAMIVVIGFELAQTSFGKILHPAQVHFTWAAAAILVLSLGVKLWLSLLNGRLAGLLDSQALAAAAADSRNDMISTGAVLLAGVAEHYTSLRIDGYMGLGVALFILYSGAQLAKETISPLLGESASPELQRLIVDRINDCPQILGHHDLMVHDYGPGQRFASIHVEMDAGEDPLVSHSIIDELERECFQSHGIHLVIHYDPVVLNDPEQDRLKAEMESLLRQADSRLRLHDFRIVPGIGFCNLIFDVTLPRELFGQEEQLRTQLEQQLNQAEGGKLRYHLVITFDPAAFNSGI